MRLYMRDYRARKKAARQPQEEPAAPSSGDPVQDFAQWSEDRLVIPPGHPRSGSPLVLPAFGIDFLQNALGHRYSLLSVARKNAKSSLIAAYLLGRLLCPSLKIEGYRAGVVSVNREKSLELKMLIQAMIESSGLLGVKVFKYPPIVEGPAGRVDFLSADKNSGAASGFDDSLIDELGLLQERDRELVNGMRSAISARDGRYIAISVMGRSPFTKEMVEQQDDPAVCVHLYRADAGCSIDDREQWAKANPGLGTIKSLAYMEDEARQALAVPSNQSDFRAYDLNQSVDPTKEMIVSLSDWEQCLKETPPRSGPVVCGLDLGGSASMTACVLYWFHTGRVEVYGAFGDYPDLIARGKKDGVGSLYQRLHDAGELWTFPGRLVPVEDFLLDVVALIPDEEVLVMGADRYRQAEVETVIEKAGLPWRLEWRGVGASMLGHGSFDIRSFQKAVVTGGWHVVRGQAVMTQAIGGSSLRYDANGNPGLDKGHGLARIDALQASTIAAGLGAVEAEKPEPDELRLVAIG